MAEADTFAAILAQAPWEENCLQLRTSMYLVKGGRRDYVAFLGSMALFLGYQIAHVRWHSESAKVNSRTIVPQTKVPVLFSLSQYIDKHRTGVGPLAGTAERHGPAHVHRHGGEIEFLICE